MCVDCRAGQRNSLTSLPSCLALQLIRPNEPDMKSFWTSTITRAVTGWKIYFFFIKKNNIFLLLFVFFFSSKKIEFCCVPSLSTLSSKIQIPPDQWNHLGFGRIQRTFAYSERPSLHIHLHRNYGIIPDRVSWIRPVRFHYCCNGKIKYPTAFIQKIQIQKRWCATGDSVWFEAL